jgi:hypothetical protein
MRMCETCVYKDSPDVSGPCATCHGSVDNYLHESSFTKEEKASLTNKAARTEKDPAGVALSTPGAKADANKPRVDLIFDGMPLALLEVARVATFGASKYSEHGWLKVPNGYQRYTAAMDRHRLQEGVLVDRDSGLSHAAHIAWNALARLELLMREGVRK